ncbi:head completion/stabilization protein [Candidatus Symbiopectobacterium sp. NZEC135]|uniref:head completion/stabilization protein n=1 Tax=Candidatus Symbiopectobacterium sp. NZEC135 TaxID=2820471 RepID=UPI002226C16A|nr:head completion/stabilization protein [Candidatus Symbiopectobacterium sp. NZEC135]MCW2482195.1 head completion/stabilization protein [Candidatus Symbiopectobacterium sp. NZEC135]
MFSGTPVDYQDAVLANDGFWPDLNLKDFQEQRKITADMDAGTVAQALLTAAGEVNTDLVSVAQRHQTNGHATASAVPGVSLDGKNLLSAQYQKAVFARAKADLMGEFATIGRRESHPGQEGDDTRKGLLAEAAIVIRTMKGLKRATVKMV